MVPCVAAAAALIKENAWTAPASSVMPGADVAGSMTGFCVMLARRPHLWFRSRRWLFLPSIVNKAACEMRLNSERFPACLVAHHLWAVPRLSSPLASKPPDLARQSWIAWASWPFILVVLLAPIPRAMPYPPLPSQPCTLPDVSVVASDRGLGPALVDPPSASPDPSAIRDPLTATPDPAPGRPRSPGLRAWDRIPGIPRGVSVLPSKDSPTGLARPPPRQRQRRRPEGRVACSPRSRHRVRFNSERDIATKQERRKECNE